MNIAIILAGGTGTRVEQDIAKQFTTIQDKSVIIYNMEDAFKITINVLNYKLWRTLKRIS